MTSEQQQIAIAEYCGWKLVAPFYIGKKLIDYPIWENGSQSSSFITRTWSDYLNDLNAMHEAEKQLLNKGDTFIRYCVELERICEDVPSAHIANASERAEAFLKTLNLWKE